MTISRQSGQAGGGHADNVTSIDYAFPSNVAVGSLVVVCVAEYAGRTAAASDCAQLSGTATLGAFALDVQAYSVGQLQSCEIFSAIVTGAGSLTVRVSGMAAGSYAVIGCDVLTTTASWDSSRKETSNNNTNTTSPVTTGSMTSAGGAAFFGATGILSSGTCTITEDGSATLVYEFEDGNTGETASVINRIVSTGTAYNPSWTISPAAGWQAVGVVYKEGAAVGIAFDAAGNSGDQAAANTYSGSASWSGTNRMLALDVSLLGAGTTVTSMTYGGAACTYIGSRATVTSLGSVEQWRICSSDSGAPGAGSNTLVVNLSGTIEFTVEWVSYTGIHQTLPTEAFNSAQATNTGSATDASVTITSIADNCWIHAAVVANDTSITAGNTTRNNISGTLGSGANEDNNAAKTPAGALTMSYSGMGITTTWAIAGYAIRPLAASGLATGYVDSIIQINRRHQGRYW